MNVLDLSVRDKSKGVNKTVSDKSDPVALASLVAAFTGDVWLVTGQPIERDKRDAVQYREPTPPPLDGGWEPEIAQREARGWQSGWLNWAGPV